MTGPTRIGRSIVVERLLPAPPSEVFAAWTDPELLAQWMSPVGHAVARLDLRTGGALRVVMVGGGIELEHTGHYLEIDPPRRLVFTWRSTYTGDHPTRVTVTLEPRGRDTALLLRHEELPPDAADSHRGGWLVLLDRLAGALRRPAAHER